MKKLFLFLNFALIAVTAAFAQIEIKSPKTVYDTEPPSLSGDFSIFNNFIVIQMDQNDADLKKLDDDEFVFSAVLDKRGKLTDIKFVKSENDVIAKWARIRLSQAPRWVPAMKDGKPVDLDLELTLHVTTVYPAFNRLGVSAFGDYIGRAFVYPEHLAAQGIKGRAIISFTVLEDGSIDIENVDIANSPHQDITDAIMTVLREAPKWSPGLIKREPQKFSYVLPFDVRPAASVK